VSHPPLESCGPVVIPGIRAILAGMSQARFLPSRHFARLGMLLVVALVFAQTSAIMHAYSHVTAHHAGTQQVCSDCLSFAPLLAAAGGAANAPTVARAAGGIRYLRSIAPLAGQTPRHSFRSRAPPSLV
jgi:hypothetical protein